MFSKICVFQDFMELNYNISSYAANENLFKNFLIFLFYAIVLPQPIKLIFPLIIQIWRRSNSVNLVQHSFLSSIYHHYSLAPHIKTVFIFHFRAACRHGNSLNSTTVNETHSSVCCQSCRAAIQTSLWLIHRNAIRLFGGLGKSHFT